MTTPLDRPTRPAATAAPDAGAYGTPVEGSRPVTERRRRKTPLGWLPWAALAAAAALVLLSLLVINAVDDDGPEGSAGDSLGQVSGSDGSGANGEDNAPDGGGEGASADGGQSASLTANGQDLLQLGAAGGLAGVAGQTAEGTARVQSVVSDEGFWVGADEQTRVFVFLTEQARQTDGESPFQVEAGQTVRLQGTVTPLEPGVVAGVAADEGRAQLEQQGHVVQATAVQLAG